MPTIASLSACLLGALSVAAADSGWSYGLRELELVDAGHDGLAHDFQVAFGDDGSRYELWWTYAHNHTFDGLRITRFGPDGSKLWSVDKDFPYYDSAKAVFASTVTSTGDFIFLVTTAKNDIGRLVRVDAQGTLGKSTHIGRVAHGLEEAHLEPLPGGDLILAVSRWDKPGAPLGLVARVTPMGGFRWKTDLSGEVGELVVDGATIYVATELKGGKRARPAIRVHALDLEGTRRWSADEPVGHGTERPRVLHSFVDAAHRVVHVARGKGSKQDPGGRFVAARFTDDGRRAGTLEFKPPKIGSKHAFADHDSRGAIVLAWRHSDNPELPSSVSKIAFPERASATGAAQTAAPTAAPLEDAQWRYQLDGLLVTGMKVMDNDGIIAWGTGKMQVAPGTFATVVRTVGLKPDGKKIGVDIFPQEKVLSYSSITSAASRSIDEVVLLGQRLGKVAHSPPEVWRVVRFVLRLRGPQRAKVKRRASP